MDSLEEWRRLRELYGRMNEGELEVVASEAYDLTEVAKPLLRDEIARRGLKIELRSERRPRGVAAPPPSRPVTDLDFQEMGVFETLEEARKVKQFLNSAGVPCFWGPDNVDDPAELVLNVDDGLHMKVRVDDVARVRGGLRELFADKPAEPDPGDCNFVCPKCHSPEIVFHDLDEAAKFNWSCDACGHEWRDDGVEQQG
ncbi:MAG TPA: hypothetical protein VK752_12505 [Bryobacteraceae bacterium]|jgi:hypothetical protein|nr:hypothetical protein [Bryobacteraceae bacterium]